MCMTTDGLRLAKKEAMKSEEVHWLGAVVIKNGRVLGRGHNQLGKSNHLTHKFFQFPTLHAEIAALCRLDPDEVRGAVLYIYRHKRTGCPGLAKPCERCAKVLAKYGIRKVIYSTDEAPYYREWKPFN